MPLVNANQRLVIPACDTTLHAAYDSRRLQSHYLHTSRPHRQCCTQGLFHLGAQELDLTVEEEFLDLLLKLVRELPMADIYQMDAQPTSQPLHSSQATQTALQVCSHPLPLHKTA